MKTLVLLPFALVGLAGCVVVPAGPPVAVGPPRVYAAPPAVVVVPARPHRWHHHHRHGYWGPRDYYR